MEITEIPPMPSVVLRVFRFDPGAESASSAALEEIVRPDKGISAQLLRVANSAYYGRAGSIKTVKDAITLLGLRPTKNLIVMVGMRELFGKLKGDAFKRPIHEYPIVTALAALDLCRPLGVPGIREEAFLSALLHNIGMVVIALNSRDGYEQVLKEAESGSENFAILEQQAFSTDHHEVGRRVFQEWQLPDDFISVPQGYAAAGSPGENQPELVRVVGLAAIVTRRMLGLHTFPSDEERIEAILKSFGKTRDLVEPMNEEYYATMQQHPFYELVMSA